MPHLSWHQAELLRKLQRPRLVHAGRGQPPAAAICRVTRIYTQSVLHHSCPTCCGRGPSRIQVAIHSSDGREGTAVLSPAPFYHQGPSTLKSTVHLPLSWLLCGDWVWNVVAVVWQSPTQETNCRMKVSRSDLQRSPLSESTDGSISEWPGAAQGGEAAHRCPLPGWAMLPLFKSLS